MQDLALAVNKMKGHNNGNLETDLIKSGRRGSGGGRQYHEESQVFIFHTPKGNINKQLSRLVF